MNHQRLCALRGAVQCQNTAGDIEKQVAALYDELLERNSLPESGIVSLIFSVTGDLDAANPAAALRQSGRAGDLALFALREAESQGSLERTIRALVHCYLPAGAAPRHVYRNGAEVLRPDRTVT
ncbi:MAG: chorismate mutase [Treponema sp.]|jgi:chorismate mutase|nr:chorismate mutase [Treponema sp.]